MFMEQIVDFAFFISQITKKQYICRTCIYTGCTVFAILQPPSKTKVTFIHRLCIPVIITGIVWTCCHTGLASHTQRCIHHYYAILLILECSLCRTDSNAWRLIALITENRKKLPYHFAGSNARLLTSQNGHPVTILRNFIGLLAYFQ